MPSWFSVENVLDGKCSFRSACGVKTRFNAPLCFPRNVAHFFVVVSKLVSDRKCKISSGYIVLELPAVSSLILCMKMTYK